jgi:hypothetical protein
MATESIAAIFGKVLREQRNARGISQEALALSAVRWSGAFASPH